MALKSKLQDDLKAAMKGGDSVAVGVLRLVIAAVKNKEIEKKTDNLPDEAVLSVLASEAKKRKDSIEQFSKAGRRELADKEKAELEIIQKYLPAQMTKEEVEKKVAAIAAKLGAKEMGPLMKAAMAELRGKADSSIINESVRRILEP